MHIVINRPAPRHAGGEPAIYDGRGVAPHSVLLSVVAAVGRLLYVTLQGLIDPSSRDTSSRLLALQPYVRALPLHARGLEVGE